ncbi:hypothetical protein GGQ88_004269, partial [Novosphingobium hassiacum]|nr:hypothetical protein [Novosphingobium hassiacum]
TTLSNNGAIVSNTLTGTQADTVAASYAVLNEQSNAGVIAATATLTYGAGFSKNGVTSVSNSSVALNGNSVIAVGYGNSANNSLSLNALNNPATAGTLSTAALASNQSNTGNVSATSGSNALAINSGVSGIGTGGVSQSSLSINGNALGSAAYGNSVTNAVTFGGTNVTLH